MMESHPVLGTLATAGASGLASMANASTMGDLYTATMGLSSYHGAEKEYLEKGATDEQAKIAALLSGAVEAGTEYLPTHHLVKSIPSNGIRNALSEGIATTFWKMLKNTNVGAGYEAIEEGVNKIGDTLIDQAVMGDASDFSRRKDSYILNNNMTAKEALGEAVMDEVKDTFYAAGTGYLSGLIGNATNNAVNHAALKRTGNTIINNRTTDSVMEMAKGFDEKAHPAQY